VSTETPANPESSPHSYDPQVGFQVQEHRRREPLTVLALVLLIVGLPVVVWLDLVNLTDASLKRQASDLNAMISAIRGYYGSDVVDRVLSAHSTTQVAPNYQDIPGAIPLPATLSLELGKVIGDKQPNISYRFVSDYPFRNRAAHVLDDFETHALASLRKNPNQPPIYQSSTGLRSQVRLVSPIVMGSACVSCHNSHPDSPKTDWKVGDVRGIQELTVTQPVSLDLSSFFYIFCYLIVASIAGVAFVMMQNRRNDTIRQINHKLRGANDFLASISSKLASYLSPQIYKSIFSGAMDVAIQTKRKKLTIFFFGDPESGGEVADAQACLRMAIDMQHRLSVLNVKWRQQGVEEPFRVRMGINTGYCNVGNFGSADRMDYTILGAEANLAARLQSIAQGGGIVVSYETYALVRDIVSAHALSPTTMKGISRDIVPYAIDGLFDASGNVVQVFAEHATGLDLYLDLGRIDPAQARTLKSVLQKAMDALDKQTPTEDGSAGG